MTLKLAFLGLGVMGYPMAGHLANKTDALVTVYNRTPAKAASWQRQYNGQTARMPADAVAQADYVFICVGNDNDLEQILTGAEGVIQAVRPGTVIIDHTTVSADISRKMACLFKKRGVNFLDAPVSGGQSGAEKGALSVMIGGDQGAFDHVAPLIRQAYGKEVRRIGVSGTGQMAKMINQICIAGVVQGLAEAMAFGQKAGLDMEEVLSVISKGAAQSWQMENRAATMLQGKFDFGFALDWMIKDLGIALDEARRQGIDLPNTEIVQGYYRELSAQGHGRLDTSALIKRLR
ncbi:MAG: NAD(P)-dependent oxidoreductase [Micavibrio aeruginosavorus]|uniref:NAD(P)-dependent oxidoreductase n=1 Tax=Micavibrio aeruginosavorus TaxID=349221 RepID=A0A7T5UGK2_9BACT|nr:MAG: NAD(P)-dependent oxidoreductase [Micavibrio aeruginosavorus]